MRKKASLKTSRFPRLRVCPGRGNLYCAAVPRASAASAGFTLIELMMVLVILSIAALMAVPMLSSAADVQIRAAANRLAADLDYARGLAVTHQQNYSVVFDPATESYSVQDAGGNVIDHPMNPGGFQVDFASDSRLSRVDLAATTFDHDTITFNYLGAPYSGAGTATPLNAGQITLQAGSFTMMVDVEPVTGYVSISQP